MKTITLALLLSALGAGFALPSHAATYTVDRTDDPDPMSADDCTDAANDCSLRGAVSKANTDAAEDNIVLPAGTYSLTRGQGAEGDTASELTISGGDLDVTQPLTITGAGAGTTTVDASGIADDDRVFHLNLGGTGTVTISGVKITGGAAGFRGGGIWAFNTALVLSNSHIQGNTAAAAQGGGVSIDNGGVNSSITGTTVSGNSAADRGGGLFYETGTVTITNSTFSGNSITTASGAGGIDITTGSATIVNSTVTGNTAVAGADTGGIRNAAGGVGVFTIKNTIVANNLVGGSGHNCANSGNDPVSGGGNLSNDATCAAAFFDAATDQNSVSGTIVNTTLADNGGTVPTHLLLSGSAAIDAVASGNCTDSSSAALTSDQRGFTRPADGDGNGTALCDAGAVEVGCGNGNVESGESCDDGNVTAGDGCSAACATETGDGDGETAVCGNGEVEDGEGCDDGNTTGGDGCSAACAVESETGLEDANPTVDFDGLRIGQSVSLSAPDPRGGSGALKASHLPATCSCAWSVTPETRGSFGTASACETTFTPEEAGTGQLSAAVDCGADGSDTFLQTIVIAAASSDGGGGCSLIR